MSDAYRVHVCERTGLIAVANLRKQSFHSQVYKSDSSIVQVRGGRGAGGGGVRREGGWRGGVRGEFELCTRATHHTVLAVVGLGEGGGLGEGAGKQSFHSHVYKGDSSIVQVGVGWERRGREKGGGGQGGGVLDRRDVESGYMSDCFLCRWGGGVRACAGGGGALGKGGICEGCVSGRGVRGWGCRQVSLCEDGVLGTGQHNVAEERGLEGGAT